MGGTLMIEQLEQEVAAFVGQPSAVMFGQGFATNSCGISCLFGPGDLLLSDSLNHSSIVVGARLSGAKVKPFRHAGTSVVFPAALSAAALSFVDRYISCGFASHNLAACTDTSV
jgi:7-keto-8-aminopelargonate synthetase-like enzyme